MTEPRRENDLRRIAREARARKEPRFRLRYPDGRYVAADLSATPVAAAHGWIGFQNHLDQVLALRPELAACRVVPVPPPSKPAPL